jgi:transcription elongation factor Elf1
MRKMAKMKLFKKKPLPLPRNCPFCGGKPRISRCGDHREFWVVECSKCYETPVQLNEARITPIGAVNIYNKRADLAERTIRAYNRVKELENEVQ